ncbi:MAG: 4-hydroxy-tetrahydrodipicolinate reductase, partial [Pseudonocardiales bacterium]|nr:4-hydroxy-tetrahydrodipicolinate reductase [Pseudonocardiales bacterium]
MTERARVGVLGARGRMGTEVCAAVRAAEDMELVAELDLGDQLSVLTETRAEVVVDFTHPGAVLDNVRFCVDHGIHCVVGTSGFDESKYAALREWLAADPGPGVLVA